MLGKTQTSSLRVRQSPEFQTRMKGGWYDVVDGVKSSRHQTDQLGKDMTTSVIRWQ